MTDSTKRGVIAVAAVAALIAIPASAAAHPSVYTDATTRTVPSSPPSPLAFGDLIPQTRYVVSNHGITYVMRETNGDTGDASILAYNRLPGAYRSQPSVPTSELIDNGGTGAQPHHVCHNGALDSVSNIEDWQEESGAGKPEPFYGYIPWQEQTAGLDDHPADWLPLVQSLTGVDLAQVTDLSANPTQAERDAVRDELEALCEAPAVGGTFVPADTVQTAATALNSGTIAGAVAAAVAPKDAEITALKAENEALKAAPGAPKALSITVTGPGTLTELADTGADVALTGPADSAVDLELGVSDKKAEKLRLSSGLIGTGKATLASDGTGSSAIELTRKAKKAVKKAKAALRVTATAIVGNTSTWSTHSLSK